MLGASAGPGALTQHMCIVGQRDNKIKIRMHDDNLAVKYGRLMDLADVSELHLYRKKIRTFIAEFFNSIYFPCII
jgi:hypothetical protein